MAAHPALAHKPAFPDIFDLQLFVWPSPYQGSAILKVMTQQDYIVGKSNLGSLLRPCWDYQEPEQAVRWICAIPECVWYKKSSCLALTSQAPLCTADLQERKCLRHPWPFQLKYNFFLQSWTPTLQRNSGTFLQGPTTGFTSTLKHWFKTLLHGWNSLLEVLSHCTVWFWQGKKPLCTSFMAIFFPIWMKS